MNLHFKVFWVIILYFSEKGSKNKIHIRFLRQLSLVVLLNKLRQKKSKESCKKKF